jgi:hypothetical protein
MPPEHPNLAALIMGPQLLWQDLIILMYQDRQGSQESVVVRRFVNSSVRRSGPSRFGGIVILMSARVKYSVRHFVRTKLKRFRYQIKRRAYVLTYYKKAYYLFNIAKVSPGRPLLMLTSSSDPGP